MQQTQNVTAKKKPTPRIAANTSATNAKWIEKNSKAFGSKSNFIDAVLTQARKSKLEVKAPMKAAPKKAVKAKSAKKPSIKRKPTKTMSNAKVQAV